MLQSLWRCLDERLVGRHQLVTLQLFVTCDDGIQLLVWQVKALDQVLYMCTPEILRPNSGEQVVLRTISSGESIKCKSAQLQPWILTKGEEEQMLNIYKFQSLIHCMLDICLCCSVLVCDPVCPDRVCILLLVSLITSSAQAPML